MKSVNTKYSYFRYDKWGRCVFYLWKKSGYWSTAKYNKAQKQHEVNYTPLEVNHKHKHLY